MIRISINHPIYTIFSNVSLVLFILLLFSHTENKAQDQSLFPDAVWLQDVHWSGTIHAGVPAPIMTNVQAHLNGVEYMFHLESDVEKARPHIEALHAQGKKYWVNLDGGIIEGNIDSILQNNPEISDPNFGAFHSLEGNLFLLGESVIRNINRTEWRDFLISCIKRAIDAGADGSQHDGGGTSTYHSFDDEEIDAFSEYIQNNGISTGDWNNGSMNFREYLLSKGKNDDNVFDNDSDPQNVKDLIQHWYDFKAVNTLNSWQIVKDSCKLYAESKGQDYTIALNAGSAVGTHLGHTYFASDYAIGEFFNWGNLFPFTGSLAAKSKTFEAFGKRYICWSAASLGDMPDANTYDNFPSPIQENVEMHLAATLYASGGLPQLKYPVENSYPAYLLPQLNRDILNSVSSAGEIGVVMSHAQTLFDYRGLEGLISVLQDINRSFKVIFFKSNRLELDDDVTQMDLSNYSVIFLPEVYYLTDNQRSQLLTYMNNGGTVIAVRGNVEYSGWVDENGNTQNNSTWASLADDTQSGIKTYGQGKFINIAHNIIESNGYPLVSYGADYIRFKYSTNSDEAQLAVSIKDTINYWFDMALNNREVYSENMPTNLRVFKYQDTLSHHYVYHLLSDSVEIPSREAIPVSPFTIELSVANSSYDKTLKATLYTIDKPYGIPLGNAFSVNQNSGRVSITLPEFSRWGILDLTESFSESSIQVSNLLLNGSSTPYRLPSNSEINVTWNSENNPSGMYQMEIWTNLNELGVPVVDHSSAQTLQSQAITSQNLKGANKVIAKIFESSNNSYAIPASELHDSTVYYLRLRAVEPNDTSQWLQQFFYRNGRPGSPREPNIYTSHQNLWYLLGQDPMAPPDTSSTVIYGLQKGMDNKGRYGGDYELDTLTYGVVVYTDSLSGQQGNVSSELYEVGRQFRNRLGPFEGDDIILDTLQFSLKHYENFGIYFQPFAFDRIDTSDAGNFFGFFLDSKNDPLHPFELLSPANNSYTQSQIPFSWENNGDPDPFMKDKKKVSKVQILFDTVATFDSPALASYSKDNNSEFDKDTVTLNLPTNFFAFEGISNYEKVYWKAKMWDVDRDAAEGGGNGQLSTESSDIFTLYIGVQPAKPNTPSLLEPQNFAKDIIVEPTLRWNSVQDVQSYKISVSKDSTFMKNVTELSSSMNSIQLSDLENDQKYFWRIKAVNNGVESDWSESWSFETIISLPESLFLLSPMNGSTVISDSVEFRWNKSEYKAEKYWFEYSTDSLFSESVIDSSLADTTKTLIGVMENNNYWWRVKARNNAGWGSFSNVFTVSILVTDLDDEDLMPVQYGLSQNYPNPFNPTTTIGFSLPKSSHVDLSIYNLLGEKVSQEINEFFSAGNYKINVNLNNLTSGIYVYKIHTEEFTQAKKMILLK